jgi:hypothetical protein
MTLVLNHVQRLILRRLAASTQAIPFLSIVPMQTRKVRAEWRIALDQLLTHDFVAISPYAPDPERYFITAKGRRELYPRASRESQ